MKPVEFDVFGHRISLFDERNDIIPEGLNNQMRLFLGGAPLVGGMIRAEDNWNYLNDYLNNRGIDWADVKYPSRTVGMPIGGMLNFVSSNISHLYD